jgi:hypothetical protein
MRLSNTLIYAMLIGAPSWATTIIGNLGTGDVSEFFVCCTNNVGVGFTMNSGTDYTLDSANVTVILPAGNVFSAQLFGTSGGNPVGPSLLDFLFPPGFVGGPAEQTINLTPNVPFTLTASTTYWLVLVGGFEWRTTNGVPAGLSATDAGTRFDSLHPPQTIVGPEHPLFEIDGTAISGTAGAPEPGTIGLVCLSLLGLFWVRRRRITL